MLVTLNPLFGREKHRCFAQPNSNEINDEILSLGGAQIRDIIQKTWATGWTTVMPHNYYEKRFFSEFCGARARVRMLVLGDPE